MTLSSHFGKMFCTVCEFGMVRKGGKNLALGGKGERIWHGEERWKEFGMVRKGGKNFF